MHVRLPRWRAGGRRAVNAVRSFLSRIRKTGVKRRDKVRTVAMGRERSFEAWDVGDDTYIFEDGIRAHLDGRPSVLIVSKCDLRRNAAGRVMTVTTERDRLFMPFIRLSDRTAPDG